MLQHHSQPQSLSQPCIGCHLSLRLLELRGQEGSGLGSIPPIAEMRRKDSGGQISIADGVANEPAAKDLVLVTGEVGDLTTVSAPLSITKADGCGNLVLDDVFDILDGAVNDSCTLARR